MCISKIKILMTMMMVVVTILLTPRSVLADGDHSGSCTGATTVTCGSSTAGHISDYWDEDHFRLTLSSNIDNVSIYTTGSVVDSVGTLYDDNDCHNHDVVAYNDDYTGNDKNFKITQNLSADTYYIRVRRNAWTDNGDYTLHIDCGTFDDHGNTCDTATAVTPGSSGSPSSTNGDIETGMDEDYFSIVLPDAGTLKVYTTSTADNTDTYGSLVDAACNPFVNDDSSGTGDNFDLTEDLPAGTYYIRVKHATNTGTGSYVLHTEFTAATVYTIGASVSDLDSDGIAGGTISPAGSVNVIEGDDETFTITPDTDYTIDDVLVDGASVGAVSTYTFTNVTANHSIAVSFNAPSVPCSIDLTDVPLDTRFRAAPANIMFVLDDSGSMDWEFITTGNDGCFWVGGSQHYYVFDDPGDNLYNDKILSRGSDRMHWKSQWAGENKLYYNPQVEYEPWPTLSDADPDTPRSHPRHSSPTFNLDGTYDTLASTDIIIDDLDDTRFSKSPDTEITIVDNRDSGFSIVSQPWNGFRSSSSGSQAYNGEYRYTSKDGDYKATWTPNLTAGKYSVYVRWDDDDHNSTNVQYTIDTNADGTDDYVVDTNGDGTPDAHPGTVNQRENGGAWVKIADDVDISTGGGRVTLTHTRDNRWDRAVADAVMYIPAGARWEWATSTQAYDDHYYFTNEDGAYTATWAPDVSGTYDVYARWVAGSNRPTTVPYTITYASGTDVVNVDQTANGGAWVLLGTYTLDNSSTIVLSHTKSAANNTVAVADAIKLTPPGGGTVTINRSHYYVWSETDNKPYLVILDGNTSTIKYYAVNDSDGDNVVDSGELAYTATPPADVQCSGTYTEERQNFANWYSFYRRRELTAAASVSRTIAQMQGVHVGIRTINGNLSQTVLNIQSGGVDETTTLLNLLYNLNLQSQGTPLRSGLKRVGQYFDQDDNVKLDGHSGNDSPFATEAQGGACQQAFAIVMTDGYYNGSNPSVGNQDKNDSAGADDYDGGYFSDEYSDTLADVAMMYYKNDLASGLSNSIQETEVDPATHQHMVTYGVSFGVHGTLISKQDSATPEDADSYDYDFDGGTKYPTWPDPTDGDQEKIDDLLHASFNGRGLFLTASNPTELIDSLLRILNDVQSRIGSASSVSVNGDELYERVNTDLRVFQSSYDSENWSGDVQSFAVDTMTGDVLTNSPDWHAKDQIDLQDWNSGRIIATYDPNKGAAGEGIPFRYSELSNAMKNLLDANATTGERILNYIRGQVYYEVSEGNGGLFRNRNSVLADIVDSSPTYKHGMLYVGSNDGMLHALDADTGNEKFAYIPNLVFENLKELVDPDYSHRFYVDATPIAADVDFTAGAASVTTMLVGGLGKGGRGFYALDISSSDASNTAQAPDILSEASLADRVLWEYPLSGGSDDDMGYTYSIPVIIKGNDDQWIVVAGNGYGSPNGHSVLYILKASDGSIYRKIDTGVGGCNGLSSPVAIDINYDGKVDYVYAGDLKGNLWKFDLTSTDHGDWGVAFENSTGDPQPLFQAKGPGGSVQPITTRPDVMRHCSQSGYIVLFGTGEYLNEADLSDTSDQTIYGIWDYGDDSDDREYLGSFTRDASKPLSNQPEGVGLLEQVEIYSAETYGVGALTQDPANWSMEADSTDSDGDAGNNNGTTADDWQSNPKPDTTTPAHLGWFFDLPIERERVTVDPIIREGHAVVISYIPDESTCTVSGDSIINEIDACSGARLEQPPFDVDGDGTVSTDFETQEVSGNEVLKNPKDWIYYNPGTNHNSSGDTDFASKLIAPSRLKRPGRLMRPAIATLNENVEIKIMSSSTANQDTKNIVVIKEKAAKFGIRYWLEYQP